MGEKMKTTLRCFSDKCGSKVRNFIRVGSLYQVQGHEVVKENEWECLDCGKRYTLPEREEKK